ncbi:hypothetical protein C1N53_08310 [Pontibacter sp. SGAir0037]|nr:hypothetical protein C1N53_08310 [Pontibacter sp. SGAir0037]
MALSYRNSASPVAYCLIQVVRQEHDLEVVLLVDAFTLVVLPIKKVSTLDADVVVHGHGEGVVLMGFFKLCPSAANRAGSCSLSACRRRLKPDLPTDWLFLFFAIVVIAWLNQIFMVVKIFTNTMLL